MFSNLNLILKTSCSNKLERKKDKKFTRVARPMVLANKNFNKIFCIGYNKTGTTTLEYLLQLYGYSLPNQKEQEMRLSKQVYATEYSEFISFVNKFDAFQDRPFSQELTYVVADALFPNSKFILTERNSEEWFNSMNKFYSKMLEINDITKITELTVREKFSYLYPGYHYQNKKRLLTVFHENTRKVLWEKLYNKEYYIKMYEERNQQIKKYFSDAPDKLLIINITEEEKTEKLCKFLSIPQQFIIKMPHKNITK